MNTYIPVLHDLATGDARFEMRPSRDGRWVDVDYTASLVAALRQIATADYNRIDVATLGNIARAALVKAGV